MSWGVVRRSVFVSDKAPEMEGVQFSVLAFLVLLHASFFDASSYKDAAEAKNRRASGQRKPFHDLQRGNMTLCTTNCSAKN